MNRLRQTLFCAFCLFAGSSMFAQELVNVKTVRATKPTRVAMPVMLDSVDQKGNKFDDKKLLETSIQFPNQEAYSRTIITTDTTNYLYLPKVQEGHSFQLVSFQLTADRYSKQTLLVKAPGMLELYVNGEKVASKTTVEDSLQIAKEVSASLTSMPSITHNVVIKYMSKAQNKADEAVKVSVKKEKKGEATQLFVTTDGKRPTKILDAMEGTRLTSTKTSPNGQYLLLSYRSVAKGGKVATFTELVDVQLGKKVNLGTSKVAWMPITNAYYKTVKVGDNLQLVSVDPATLGETILAPAIPSGNFHFLPNEKTLLYTEKESYDERKGDLKILGGPDDRQAGYYDEYFIYKYDLEAGVKTRLTYGKRGTYIRDISADSRYILFSTVTETITKRPFRVSSMYRLDLNDLSLETIWSNEAFAQSAQFSPDGTELLITGSPEAFGGIGLNIKEGQIANSYDTQAYIMDLYTKQIEPISKDFNPAIKSVEWHKSTKLIYLQTTDKDYERVYTYNSKSQQYKLLPLQEDVIASFSIASSTGKASYTGQSIMNSAKAYSLDLGNQKSNLVSDPTKDIFAELKLGKVEDWSFKASDGTRIEGRYYLPPNFDASKKYPMIVYYYGGTTPTSRTFEHPYSMHVYAAMGYVVYTIQPSGAIGYGQEFSARHVNAWGKRTAEDIIEGTKQFLKEHTYVNEKKIGCVGASYGGFMTMYLQTQTDLFAAAISHAGISSLSSYWGEGYWGYSYSSGASAHSYPWNNKEMYIEQSPLFNADKINTPLLLLHGTVDTNVPMGESIQMYTALKILGKPVEFIQVKDENHGIAKYERRLQWNYSIYSWFEKWLKDDSDWWNTLYPSRK